MQTEETSLHFPSAQSHPQIKSAVHMCIKEAGEDKQTVVVTSVSVCATFF